MLSPRYIPRGILYRALPGGSIEGLSTYVSAVSTCVILQQRAMYNCTSLLLYVPFMSPLAPIPYEEMEEVPTFGVPFN